jgi:hypothetical protein
MAALTAENEGDLAAAKTMWIELVEQYSNELSDAKRLWAWHAQKKLNDLTQKTRQLNDLIAQLDKMRLDDVDAKFDDELDTRVIAAIRLEQLGDYSLARDRWDQIAKTLKGDQKRRPAFVLACGKTKDLESSKTPKDAAERAVLISKTIDKAKGLLANPIPARKRDGRNLLRDIRDLYAGDGGDIGKLVDQAKKLLADNPPV